MSCNGLREDWSKVKKLDEMPERLEPWCQLVQTILAEEFDVPPVNVRKLSEKIIMKVFLRMGVVFPFSDNIGREIKN